MTTDIQNAGSQAVYRPTRTNMSQPAVCFLDSPEDVS